MKSPLTWVVVADGANARIFSRDGKARKLAPVAGGSFELESLRSSEIADDRPARAMGILRKSLPQRLRDRVEAEFVRDCANQSAEDVFGLVGGSLPL